MATSMITGSTATIGTQGVTAGQRVIDMADRIYLLQPEAAPLYVLVSKLNKRPAINTTILWLEDDLNPTWSYLAASATSAETALTTATSEGLYFNKNDLVKIPATGEIMLITASTTSAVTAVRGYGSTAAASAASGAWVVILGSAFGEGSLGTDLVAKSTKTSQKTNYLQLFRKGVDISKTLANTELYGGSDRMYQRKKKGIELMRDMERTFLFGEPYEDAASKDSGLTNGRRVTGGINYFISTNSTAVGGILTEADFESFLRTLFRYGSTERYLFCAPLIISVISQWAQGKEFALYKFLLINGKSLRRLSSTSLNTVATTERRNSLYREMRQSELDTNEYPEVGRNDQPRSVRTSNNLKLHMYPKDKTLTPIGPCIKNLTKSVEVHSMDNTEERLSEKDLGWLAGILDGEGSIGIYNYGRKGIVSRVEISNTDKNLVLDAIYMVSKLIDHPIKLKTRIPKSQFEIKNKKRQYSFQLSNMKLIYKFLSSIKNDLRSFKKQLASLICEYADLRKERAYKSGLTKREQDILSQIGRIRNDYTSDCSDEQKI